MRLGHCFADDAQAIFQNGFLIQNHTSFNASFYFAIDSVSMLTSPVSIPRVTSGMRVSIFLT